MIRKSLVIGTLLLPSVLFATDPTTVMIDTGQLAEITGANTAANSNILTALTNNATTAAASNASMLGVLNQLYSFVSTYFAGTPGEAPGSVTTLTTGGTINTWLTNVGDPGTKVVVPAIDAQAAIFLSPIGGDPGSIFYNNHKIDATSIDATTNKVKDTVVFPDLNIANLLAPTKFTAPQTSLAQTIVQNLVNPMPPGIDYTQDLTQTKNQDEVASFLSQLPSMSVAANSYLNMLAMRQTDQSGNSLMDQLATEGTWRFLNSQLNAATPLNWYTQINTLSTEGILRELAVMDAFRLYMEHEKFKQGERIEALLASMVASQGRLAKVMGAVADSMQQSHQAAQAASAGLNSSASAPNMSSGN